MRKWKLQFFGRRIGHPGTDGPVTIEVEAPSPAMARLSALLTHVISGGLDGVTVLPMTPEERR